jgi:hypothetical protein
MFLARDSFLYSLSYELSKMRRILLNHKIKMVESLWAINISCQWHFFRQTLEGADTHQHAFRWCCHRQLSRNPSGDNAAQHLANLVQLSQVSYYRVNKKHRSYFRGTERRTRKVDRVS